MHPPDPKPSGRETALHLPLMSTFRALDTATPLTTGFSSVYLPLDWKTPTQSPPFRKHLPIDLLAHLTISLGDGLSSFPLILKTLPPPGTNISPAALMTRTYVALRCRARQQLLDQWAPDFLPQPTTSIHLA